MHDETRVALIRLALHAALADGVGSPPERAALERLRQAHPGVIPSIDSILDGMQHRQIPVAELVAPFTDRTSRDEAWASCLAVCEADGEPTPAERWFLNEIRTALQLDPEPAAATEAAAEAVAATVPLAAPPVLGGTREPQVTPPSIVPDAQALDATILRHALIAGGLELLPDTLATMTILPVQMKLVYTVGKAHGITLDRGHIVEFLGVVGVGMASQVVERFATRWVSGLAGKFLGGVGRTLVAQATASGVSFATTYALGQLARQYYAGGRSLGAIELRRLFESLLGEGRRLQQQYLPQIQQQGASLRGANLAQLVQRL